MPIVAVAGLALAGWWAIQLAMVLRSSPGQPARGDQYPFRVSRRTYLAGCVLGIVAGFLMFALGWFVLPA